MEEIESPETSVRRRLPSDSDYGGFAFAFAEARQQTHQPEGAVSDGSNLTLDVQIGIVPSKYMCRAIVNMEYLRSNVNAPGKRWLAPWLPLTDQATSLFLSRVTDTLVMGLVTLTSLTATYLLAWGKPGTNCIPNFNTTVTNCTTTFNSSKYPDASWHQISSAILPFVIFPISLYCSGLAKIAETDKRPISCVAKICVFEFLLVIALGAEMAYCMMGVPFYDVLAAIILPIAVLLVVWSFTFKYPKLLPIHRKWSEGGP